MFHEFYILRILYFTNFSLQIIVAGDGGAVEQVKLSFSEEDDPQSSFFYLDRIHSAQEHDDIITGK